MPELEERKTTLTLMNASMKAELLEIESKMLTLLSASEGDILDDTELVETLSHAKTMSQELTRKASGLCDSGCVLIDGRFCMSLLCR